MIPLKIRLLQAKSPIEAMSLKHWDNREDDPSRFRFSARIHVDRFRHGKHIERAAVPRINEGT
jgi:hypothetical protein